MAQVKGFGGVFRNLKPKDVVFDPTLCAQKPILFRMASKEVFVNKKSMNWYQ